MKKTYAELLIQAGVIKNATAEGSNTPTRVGQMFVDLVDSLPTILGGNLWTNCGAWDATSNVLPATGGTGDSGDIVTGNIFTATGSSTSLHGPDGGAILDGTILIALIDNPATIADFLFIPSITA